LVQVQYWYWYKEKERFIQIKSTKIEFDGGTTCNIPSRGYGNGYGSYRINGGKIVKLSFNCPMSCNAGEVLTLFFAIRAAALSGAKTLHVVGDSQIALKWARIAAGLRKRKGKEGKGTREFGLAIDLLIRASEGLSITTEWIPRQKALAVFGH
jgi:hypothetical protein